MRRFVQAFEGLPLGQPPEVLDAPGRYNIGKGDSAWVIREVDGSLAWTEMQWGLVPAWSKAPETKYTTVTARLDRAPKSRIFAGPWRDRHCLVPMTGYYKWDRSTKPGVPHFIHEANGGTLFAAGLWEHWAREEPGLLSFSFLTRENDAIPAPLTPDGPVFMPERQGHAWVRGTLLLPHLRLKTMAQPDLAAYAVSPAHRDRSRDDYTLLEPRDASLPADADRQDDDDPDDEDL